MNIIKMKINEIGSLSILDYELYRKSKQSANVNKFHSIHAGALWEGWREEQGHLSYLKRIISTSPIRLDTVLTIQYNFF